MTNLYSTEGKILRCICTDRGAWFVKCCTFTTAYLVIFNTAHCFSPQVILYNVLLYIKQTWSLVSVLEHRVTSPKSQDLCKRCHYHVQTGTITKGQTENKSFSVIKLSLHPVNNLESTHTHRLIALGEKANKHRRHDTNKWAETSHWTQLLSETWASVI